MHIIESWGSSFRRHCIRMPEAIPVFDDPNAITITDDESDPGEQRFVTVGTGGCGSLAGRRLHLSQREHPDHFRATR